MQGHILFIFNKWWSVEAFNGDMCLSKVNLLLILMPRYFYVVEGGIMV